MGYGRMILIAPADTGYGRLMTMVEYIGFSLSELREDEQLCDVELEVRLYSYLR